MTEIFPTSGGTGQRILLYMEKQLYKLDVLSNIYIIILIEINIKQLKHIFL